MPPAYAYIFKMTAKMFYHLCSVSIKMEQLQYAIHLPQPIMFIFATGIHTKKLNEWKNTCNCSEFKPGIVQNLVRKCFRKNDVNLKKIVLNIIDEWRTDLCLDWPDFIESTVETAKVQFILNKKRQVQPDYYLLCAHLFSFLSTVYQKENMYIVAENYVPCFWFWTYQEFTLDKKLFTNIS